MNAAQKLKISEDFHHF